MLDDDHRVARCDQAVELPLPDAAGRRRLIVLYGEGLDLGTADDRLIAETVGTIAEERGVPRAQVALAWVAANPVVTAPIVGATKPHHISDAVAAVDLVLGDDERARLEADYQPHAPAGF